MRINIFAIAGAACLFLATVFIIVGLSGWSKANFPIPSPSTSFDLTLKVGTVGICAAASFSGISAESCRSWSDYESAGFNYGGTTSTSTGTVPNNNYATDGVFGNFDRVKAGGAVAITFVVLAFVLCLVAFALLVMLFLDLGYRNKMITVGIIAVACVFCLIAWVVFTACFWSSVKKATLDIDWKPDYALVLTAIAFLFLIPAAALVYLAEFGSSTAK